MLAREIVQKIEETIRHDHSIHEHWLRDVLPNVIQSIMVPCSQPLLSESHLAIHLATNVHDHSIHEHWLRDVLPNVIRSIVADYMVPLWIVNAKQLVLTSDEMEECWTCGESALRLTENTTICPQLHLELGIPSPFT